MTEPKPRRERPLVRALNRSFLGAAAQPGALALTATAGLVGGPADVAIAGVVAAGGMVGGLLPDLVSAVSSRVGIARARNAEAALSVAAQDSGLGNGEFTARIEANPFIARVAYETVQGAADATYDEKIDALGRVLGRAMSSESVSDQHRVLAQSTVLRGIEEVHAVVLWTLTKEPPFAGADQDGEWFAWTLPTLFQELGLGALLTPVIEGLLAQGLIHDMVQSDGHRSHYALSAWGQEILDLLMEADPTGGPAPSP